MGIYKYGEQNNECVVQDNSECFVFIDGEEDIMDILKELIKNEYTK